MHVQYHHHLHGTESCFHELFSWTMIHIIFFCKVKRRVMSVYLFFQCPFKAQCAYLEAHNEQSDTLKEKAPGRRCSPGTGQHGCFTTLFYSEHRMIERWLSSSVVNNSNGLFKIETDDTPAYLKEYILKPVFINKCIMKLKLTDDYYLSIQSLIWLTGR